MPGSSARRCPRDTSPCRLLWTNRNRASARPAAALQSDAAGGGGGRIDAAVARHAAVITLGALGGNVAAVEIALHLVRWTIERIAVAGAAGQPQLENLVGCRERHE